MTETRLMNILRKVCEKANNSEDTYYAHPVPFNDSFYRTNMKTILSSLEHLFPDCNVSHTLLGVGVDGTLYDISKLDDVNKVDSVLVESYIYIDWAPTA